MKKIKTLLGAHVSAAGGLHTAFDRAQKINANCIQIFTKSNRQWRAKEILKEEQELFIQKQKESNILVVAHAAYLINLGSKNDETTQKAIDALTIELKRCEQLNIPYLVLHPGTARYEDKKKSLEFIAHNIDIAIGQSSIKKTTLLIETMAGQGNNLGGTFEDIATILQHSKRTKNLGVCFDTCHVFAAGYQYQNTDTYNAMWKQFDETIGLNNLKVFHLNDSKKELGSHRDRHEHISQGKIPINSFAMLMQDARFIDIPKILETPKDHEFEDDIKNMKILKDFL